MLKYSMRILRMRKVARKLANSFLIAPFFAWSVTLVPRSLLLNCTKHLLRRLSPSQAFFVLSDNTPSAA